jgi:hypothetical protein
MAGDPKPETLNPKQRQPLGRRIVQNKANPPERLADKSATRTGGQVRRRPGDCHGPSGLAMTLSASCPGAFVAIPIRQNEPNLGCSRDCHGPLGLAMTLSVWCLGAFVAVTYSVKRTQIPPKGVEDRGLGESRAGTEGSENGGMG